jgi:hypothetical protein
VNRDPGDATFNRSCVKSDPIGANRDPIAVSRNPADANCDRTDVNRDLQNVSSDLRYVNCGINRSRLLSEYPSQHKRLIPAFIF